jgi:DNA-binding HxlR family transcriptional regulator
MPLKQLSPENFTETQWALLSELKQNMATDGTDRKEPMREIFARLGDRWSMLLLLILRTGPMRSGALRRVTSELSHEGKISQRIFTLQIRALENDGLVKRTIIEANPPQVEYELTAIGLGLMDKVEITMDWIRKNYKNPTK